MKKNLGNVISDTPPPAPSLQGARCQNPDEFLAHRASFGNTPYAVNILDQNRAPYETWYFSNDLQEAVAIGLRWHERNCALEQFPEEQDGHVVYPNCGRPKTVRRWLTDFRRPEEKIRVL